MAKAKQTPVAEAPAKPAVDIAAELASKLNQSAAEERGDADVNVDVPQRKIAGGKATWKGVMELPNGKGGVLVKFAVKTCKAIEDEKFERHMYHGAEITVGEGDEAETHTCFGSLRQLNMRCEDCGTEVNKASAVKGIKTDGVVILITDEELAALVAQNEKTMRITEYVEASEIDPIYFESTEFLYPEEEKSKAAQNTFSVLGGFLRATGKVAKGIRVKRGKQQEFVVRPYGNNGLTINIIRAEYEVRDASSLWQVSGEVAEMVEMFQTLDETYELTKTFTPAKRDQFHANKDKLIAAKKAGKVADCPTPEPEQKGTDDLLAALKAAVAAKVGK